MNHERLYILVTGKATESYISQLQQRAEAMAEIMEEPLVIYDNRNEPDGIAELVKNSEQLQSSLADMLRKLDSTKKIEIGKHTVDLTNPDRRN